MPEPTTKRGRVIRNSVFIALLLLLAPIATDKFVPFRITPPEAPGRITVQTGSFKPRTILQPEEWPNYFESMPWNVQLYRAINNARHPVMDVVCRAITFQDFGVYLLPALALLWFFRREKCLVLVLAFLAQNLLVHALKEMCNQPRPPQFFADAHLIRQYLGCSFPSGDAASAAMLAVVVGYRERWLVWLPMAALALFIAYERIYIGVHFPLDVSAGLAIGALSTWAVCYWFTKPGECSPVCVDAESDLKPSCPTE